MEIYLVLQNTLILTYANDDKGRHTIEKPDIHNVENNTIEEKCQWEAEKDCDNAPKCQPQGKRSQDEDKDNYKYNRKYRQSQIVPVYFLNLVIVYIRSTVQNSHLAETEQKFICPIMHMYVSGESGDEVLKRL